MGGGEKSVGNSRAGAGGGVFSVRHLKTKGPDTPAEHGRWTGEKWGKGC